MPKQFVRVSKFRHVFGEKYKKEHWYDGIQVTKNAHDSSFCAANSKFVAVVVEAGGGGAFIVIPIAKTGRVDVNHPKVCGHRNNVADIKWNPFNDNIIASASDDTTIKLWQIPDNGLDSDLRESIVDLIGHQKRVSNISWHPTANNILASVGFDHCLIVWDVSRADPVHVLTCHSDVINCLCWNPTGDLLATTSRDKKIRIIDPRKEIVVLEAQGHQGTKGSRICFLKENKLMTTGFSFSNQRELAIWDLEDMERPLLTEDIDNGTSPLFIHFDEDTNMVYLAGRGDGNIRYFEVTFSPLGLYFLSEFRSSSPQRGLTALSKRALRVQDCEIYRFYKLNCNSLEPISMIVPRKPSPEFPSDLYPLTQGDTPSLEARQWLDGQDADPILISLQDGFKPASKEFHAPEKTQETLVQSSRNMAPHTEKELREAFYAQQEEIIKLKEMLQAKDLKIRHLERRMSRATTH